MNGDNLVASPVLERVFNMQGDNINTNTKVIVL